MEMDEIIRRLEKIANHAIHFIGDQPFVMSLDDGIAVKDAIALLKEQETEWEKIWEAPDRTYKGRCKRCGFVHIFIENHDLQYNFCPSCGRSVK